MFNKLKRHCWDQELLNVLAPQGRYTYSDIGRHYRKGRSLRLGGKNLIKKEEQCDDLIKKEVKSEDSEECDSSQERIK